MFKKIKAIFNKDKSPLKTKSLNFKYGDKTILKDLNINIDSSKIVAIIGKSGSGKSTFLKLITGVIAKRFKGKITILGHSRMFSKKDIGYIPQETSLIPDLTLEENIKLFGGLNGLSEKISLTQGIKLLKTLHLDESLAKTPNELSGGQKVRFNIIISLLHDPAVVILDEPFVGLDFFNRRLLWHFFSSLKKRGKSVILTTHLLTEIENNTDQILVLNKGRIQISGNSNQIKEKLKTHKVLELKFNKRLNEDKILDINEYCRKKTVKLLDHYEDIAMFSIESDKQKQLLIGFLKKNKMQNSIMTYKTPSLDEAFMRA